MGGLVRVGATPNYNDTNQRQRSGNDSVYGPGLDGTVVISTNTTISRDMYYDNLTVNSNVTLNTNGFRIFVKNSLIINGTISTGSTHTTGTLATPVSSDGGNVTNSIGSSTTDNVYTATSITDGQKKNIEALISGTLVINDGTVVAISGGAPGKTGSNGTVTPATNGGSGSLNRNPLVPGGPGTPGSSVSASTGGAGGKGGPVTVIAAKTITGSGSITSSAGDSSLGQASQTGANGTAAPNATVTHHVDGSAHYITGDGSTGPHASTPTPNLPHGGHVPHTYNYRHGYTYHHVHRGNVHHSTCSGDCGHLCGNNDSRGHYDHGHNHSGGNYGHHSGDYNNTSHIDSPDLYPTYYSINGINHTPGHRGNIGEARIGHNSHTSGYFHHGHDAPHHSHDTGGHGGKLSCGAYHIAYAYPRHHWQQNHGTYIERSAGSVSSSGSVTKTGGTAGQGGSSTAGQNGIPGAGGGIVIVYDTMSESITTSALGGYVGNLNTQAPSGQVIKISNL